MCIGEPGKTLQKDEVHGKRCEGTSQEVTIQSTIKMKKPGSVLTEVIMSEKRGYKKRTTQYDKYNWYYRTETRASSF